MAIQSKRQTTKYVSSLGNDISVASPGQALVFTADHETIIYNATLVMNQAVAVSGLEMYLSLNRDSVITNLLYTGVAAATNSRIWQMNSPIVLQAGDSLRWDVEEGQAAATVDVGIFGETARY